MKFKMPNEKQRLIIGALFILAGVVSIYFNHRDEERQKEIERRSMGNMFQRMQMQRMQLTNHTKQK